MVLADALARTLAVVGTVSGLAGVVIAALVYRRDRPRLVLTARSVKRSDGETVDVTVLNDGHRAITIADVTIGYSVVWEKSRWRVVRRYRVRQWKRAARDVPSIVDYNVMGMQVHGSSENAGAVLLAPAAHCVYKFPLTSLQLVRSLPFLYVAATDVIGRTVKTPLPPHLREEIHATFAAAVSEATGTGA